MASEPGNVTADGGKPDIPSRPTTGTPRARLAGYGGLALILLVGLVARAALSFCEGYAFDVNLFLRWMRGLTEHGIAGFFARDASCNYPPLYLLLLRILGAALSHWDPGLTGAAALRVWLRLPACLADTAIALLLYFELRRLARARGATALTASRLALVGAALYYLNPAALYDSAYWGQVDSVHSAFALAAVVALNRQRPLWAGAALALAVLQKLQAIVFLPLVLFDVYRWRRWRGLLWCVLGAVLGAAPVLTPYAYGRVLGTALERGYVRVVGQYNSLSQNAFNPWYATGRPGIPDDSVPASIVRLVAGGRPAVGDGESWLLQLTYRRLALGLFVLLTAVILSFYRRCRQPEERALAGGLLVLAFFLTLTEMHERYAFPVLAVLPLWAVWSGWRERLYVLVSVLLLLNLAVAQPVGPIGGNVAWALLILGGVGLAALASRGRRQRSQRAATEVTGETTIPATAVAEPPPPSRLVAWFARVTWLVLLAVVLAAAVVGWRVARVPDGREPDVRYLSGLTPVSQSHEYGTLGVDRSLEGGVIHLSDQWYLRGLGMHAGSHVEYDLPEGCTRFRGKVGIDRHFTGTASVTVHLDQHVALPPTILRAGEPPLDIDIALGAARRLRLTVSRSGSVKGAHVDWALARLE